MSTDRTWFDDKLKSNLFLDVGFRACIWLSIAFISFKHVSAREGYSPVQAIEHGFNVVMPVMTSILPFCLVLCFLALILKDLQFVSPNHWGQNAFLGRAGGVARRLAGDLTLWILGALVTLTASVLVLVFYAYKYDQWSDGLMQFVVIVGMVLCISIAVFSWVSVWVRRDVSLVSSHSKFLKIFNTPLKVLVFYGLWILATVFAGGFSDRNASHDDLGCLCSRSR